MKPLLPFLAVLFAMSCATRRPAASFRVLPAAPAYLLRSPDLKETPFPEVLASYTGGGVAWVDLGPQIVLQVENAYFREGAPRRGIEGFLGTEVAQYRARTGGGLRLVSVKSKVDQRPKDQPRVQDLLPDSMANYRRHRFFYQVMFKSKGEVRGAVLLGAESMDAIERLGARLLIDPDSVCGGQPTQCTVFPESCTVSLEMEIVVNGHPRTVLWGNFLASIAIRPRRVEVLRSYAGRLTRVEIDSSDPKALQLPLLPGDHVNWE